MKKLLFFLFATAICLQTFAVPADSKPRTVTQLNGEEVTLIMNGDEYIHWAETLDGYTLLINSEHYFCYAQLNASGDLEPSHYVATEISDRSPEVNVWLQNINRNLFYSDKQVYDYMQLREIFEIENDREITGQTGERKLLVIFMEFTDRPAKRTREEFNMLFNQINYYENGFKGSMKDFFLESSYNKLNVTCTVAGPFTAPNTALYYYPDNRWHLFAQHSIQTAIAGGVDFSEFANDSKQVESIYIIYAGHDQSNGCSTCIWAHAQRQFNYNYGGFLFKQYAASSELEGNTGNALATIGTFCHEFGHSLGALDFYDTNYATGGQYQGTGYWDLQASGSNNDGGRIPATPNPRSKVQTYGWATAIELNTPQRCTIPVSRIYDNAYFRINTPAANQYFIIENKKQEGFDAGVPGKNLLIYRCTDVYETSTPYPQNTTSWQRFYPVAANAKVKVPEAGTNKQSQYGTINSSTCTWPQTNQTSFTNTSIPGMVTWDEAGVNKPITNIQVFDDYITFNFLGGGNKSNFHVFLPAYYGCMVTAQSGSISPVNAGGSFSFTIDILPTHNKSTLIVTANHDPITPSGNVYTISNIQADQIVRIEGLQFNSFPITATAGENGMITPEGDVQVNEGGLQMFEIRPDNGYSIDKVVVDGVDKGNIKSYTFMNVNEPHTIDATFKKGNLYTINTSEDYFYFETYTGIPSDSVEVTVSSPNVIASIAVSAPNRFQVSADNGKNWQQGFSITTNKLPFKFYIRFAPPSQQSSAGTFNEVLTLKSTEAYADIKLTGKAHLGINDNANENAIAIYPNPTTGKLIIENGELRIEKIEIFDAFGRKVSSYHLIIPSSYQELDITNFSAGIYLITIHTDKGIVNKKVVKE